MKYLALLLLSIPCWADIPTPTGGFLWATPTSYTAGNVEGEYSPDMPEIYSLQFGPSLTSQFYFKVGDIEYTGEFSSWSFTNGLFSGSFTGSQLNFSHNSWSLLGWSSISGTLTQQLNLVPNCVGYECGSMAFGSLSLGGDELKAVPEPATFWMMILSATFVFVAGPTKRVSFLKGLVRG